MRGFTLSKITLSILNQRHATALELLDSLGLLKNIIKNEASFYSSWGHGRRMHDSKPQFSKIAGHYYSTHSAASFCSSPHIPKKNTQCIALTCHLSKNTRLGWYSSLQTPPSPLQAGMRAANKSIGRAVSNLGAQQPSPIRYLLLLPPLIAAGLCKWQLDRRQWKIDLLERRQRIMKAEPIDVFSDDMPSQPQEYQRVKATGKFDHPRTQYIGPRPRSRMGTTEVGYLAVTPLIDQSNPKRQIMVLRGWVPKSWRSPSDEKPSDKDTNDGITTIQGVVREGEDPGTFVPDNIPDQGTWFYIDGSQLAQAAGLPAGTPLVEVISPDEDVKILDSGPTVMDVLGGRGRLPTAKEETYPLAKSEGDMGAFSVMPRDHLNYAATWFTLMVATGFMAIKAIRKK